MVLAPGGRAFTRLCVAGGFAGPELRQRSAPSREDDLAKAWLRTLKDGGDTGAWAGGVLGRAGGHEIELGDRTVVPVLPPLSSVSK
jgi:hypothetical protein